MIRLNRTDPLHVTNLLANLSDTSNEFACS